MPATLIDPGNCKCREHKVIGEKPQPIVGLGIHIRDSPQRIRIRFGRVDRSEDHGLKRQIETLTVAVAELQLAAQRREELIAERDTKIVDLESSLVAIKLERDECRS